MDDHGRHLAALSTLWNKIERRLKEAEQLRGEAIVASINEMRYAGRRIVDVLHLQTLTATEKRTIEIFEHLVVAKNYLINADHDVTDSICFFVHKRVRRTVEKYGVETVSELCEGFAALYPRIKEVDLLVQKSRETRIERNDAYDELEKNYIPKVTKLYERLITIPELYISDGEDWRGLRRRVNFIKWLAIIASVFGIIGTILTTVSWIYPWSDFKNLFPDWATILGYLKHLFR